MHKLIVIGDSNVYRNVTSEKFAKRVGHGVTMINATKKYTLELGLKEVAKAKCETLIVSVLANLLCDGALEVSPIDLSGNLQGTAMEFLTSLTTISGSAHRVLLVPLFTRTTPAWFPEHMNTINDLLQDKIKSIRNAVLLPAFKVQVTDLISDGVHLSPVAGGVFFDYLVSCYLDLATPALEISHGAPNSSVDFASRVLPNIFHQGSEATIADVLDLLKSTVIPKLDDVPLTKKRTDLIEKKMVARMESDDVMFARHSEELDHLSNERWANRVVVVGLPSVNYPTTLAERKTFLSTKVRPLIEDILGEIVYDVYPRPGNDDRDVVPPFEIRLPTVQDCNKFKREAYKKVRDNPTLLGEVGFHPKVTLASRVRVEVLRAITRTLISPEQSAYCPIYNLRPILHVGPQKDGKVQRHETLTYVDAVLRFRHLLTFRDLSFAYARVGKGFHNCLRQTFIVLNDEDRANYVSTPRPGATQNARGTKRPATYAESARTRGSFRGKRAK